MHTKYKGSIKKRLIWMMLLVTSITGAIGYGSFAYWYINNQHKRALTLAHTIGLVIGQDVAKIVLLNDVSAASDVTTQLKSFKTLQSMVLYKLDKKPIFQYNKHNKTFDVSALPKNHKHKIVIKDNYLTLYIDAIYQKTHLGYVELTFKVDSIWDVIKRDINMLFLVSFIVLLFSYLLAIFFSQKFTEPILKLVKFLEKIEILDSLKERIVSYEKNEYGQLYDEVNYMLERIEKAQKAEKLAAVAFETQTGMAITDANQVILKVNKAFSKITGYEPYEVVGKTPAILKSGVQDDQFYKNMKEILNRYKYWSGEIYNKHKDGRIFPEHLTIQSVLDDQGNVIYYVSSFIDLTLQKETEAKLEYLKQYDPLTGLANKELLLSNIQQYLNGKFEKWGALICVDIKDFKVINEAYGHENGDILLQKITVRLKNEFQHSDTISRIGADEFALWFKQIGKDKKEAILESKLIAEDLIRILSEPFF